MGISVGRYCTVSKPKAKTGDAATVDYSIKGLRDRHRARRKLSTVR